MTVTSDSDQKRLAYQFQGCSTTDWSDHVNFLPVQNRT